MDAHPGGVLFFSDVNLDAILKIGAQTAVDNWTPQFTVLSNGNTATSGTIAATGNISSTTGTITANWNISTTNGTISSNGNISTFNGKNNHSRASL